MSQTSKFDLHHTSDSNVKLDHRPVEMCFVVADLEVFRPQSDVDFFNMLAGSC